MVLAQTEQNHYMGKASGSDANMPQQCRRRRRRADVWRTEPFDPTVQRNAGRSSTVDMEESRHVRGRFGSGGERNAEKHVSRNIHRGNGEIQEWEGVQNYQESTSRTFGQEVISVRTSEGFVRTSTWQVADVRRFLVSASHVIQARSGLVHREE